MSKIHCAKIEGHDVEIQYGGESMVMFIDDFNSMCFDYVMSEIDKQINDWERVKLKLMGGSQ